MEMLIFLGIIGFIIFMPNIKAKVANKEYMQSEQAMNELGYRYDYERFSEIRDEVMMDRHKNPEKYYAPNYMQEMKNVSKEINKRCGNEKLRNKSDW